MRVVYSLSDARLDRNSVVTIGAFDGVHRGHRAVLDSVRAAAQTQGRASVVVTFFPHPSVVLGRAEPFYLTSTEEKIAALEALDIDWLVVMPFTIETSHTRAADYVAQLVEHLHMREVHVGYDFAFGYRREGNVAFLQEAGPQYGFEVRVIEALTNGGRPISSTAVRNALRMGDVETAARWLGRPFRVSGGVTQHVRQLDGSFTAALDVWQEHAIPADGVYACQAWIGDSSIGATARVGTQRSPAAQPRRTIDARLPRTDRSLDNAHIALDFLTRTRTGEP